MLDKGPREDWIEVGSTALHYVDSGEGAPIFVLIHEMGGPLNSWDWLVPYLPTSCRVTRYDFRGHGLSEKTRGALALRMLVEDAAALLDRLSIGAPVVLLGCAVGGAIALSFAARFPERSAAVVALAPSTTVPSERRELVLQRAEDLERHGVRPSLGEALLRGYPQILRRERSVFERVSAQRLGADPILNAGSCRGRDRRLPAAPRSRQVHLECARAGHRQNSLAGSRLEAKNRTIWEELTMRQFTETNSERSSVAASTALLSPSRRAVSAMLLGGVLAMGSSGAASADDSAQPIRLGAILPLTGPSASVGVQQQRGLLFGVARTNAAGGVGGRKLEILFEDSQGKPDQAVISFNKLTDLYSVPLIFAAFSGPTLAMAPLATRKQIVLVNGGAQADKLANASPYLFNTIPVSGDEIAILSKYLISINKKRAAILYENNAAGTSGRDDFVASFGKEGGDIVGQEPSSFSQTDYRPALLKLANATPDVLFVMLTDGLAPFADQLLQMKPPFMIAGTSFFNDPDALRNPGSNGWLHTQIRIVAPPETATAFKTMFDVEMEFWGTQYSNAVFIVAKAIEKVLADNQPVTGTALRKSILDIRKFDVMLPAVFVNNTARMEIDIVQTQDGHHQLVQSFKAD